MTLNTSIELFSNNSSRSNPIFYTFFSQLEAKKALSSTKKKTVMKTTRKRETRDLFKLVMKPVLNEDKAETSFERLVPLINNFHQCIGCNWKFELLEEYTKHIEDCYNQKAEEASRLSSSSDRSISQRRRRRQRSYSSSRSVSSGSNRPSGSVRRQLQTHREEQRKAEAKKQAKNVPLAEREEKLVRLILFCFKWILSRHGSEPRSAEWCRAAS